MSWTYRPSRSRLAVTRSRVTPGMSWTIEMSRRVSALRREDLPTLGRPTIAMTGGRFIGGILGHIGRWAMPGDFGRAGEGRARSVGKRQTARTEPRPPEDAARAEPRPPAVPLALPAA